MKMRFGMAGAVLLAAIGPADMVMSAAAPAPAAESPAAIAESRRPAYREMSDALGDLMGEAQRPSPRPERLRALMATVDAFATRRQYQLFPAGSGPETGARTRALPSVWTDAAAFRTSQDSFADQVRGLSASLAAGNVTALPGQISRMSGICGDCHQGFRGPPLP